MKTGRIAIFASFSGAGGVERMLLNLAAGIRDAGYGVDLLTIRRDSRHLTELPAGVRHLPLPGGHAWTAMPALVRYLRREPPAALLAAKDRANRAAVLARALAGRSMPLGLRLGTHLGGVRGARRTLGDRLRGAVYRRANAVIVVSQAMADDLIPRFGLPPQRLRVIRNPVLTPGLASRAQAPCPHPWLQDGTPVIVGMGRFTRQKDFPTLLRAFAGLRAQRPARLVLLGEGGGQADCAALAASLGIADAVLLPGFVANPHAWLARAQLFVLSSRWEGSPNALAEALALGVPSVATDCLSGPRELLADGRYGPLVPVGDAPALGAAMAATLAAPLPAATLRQAVRDYRQDTAAAAYLHALGLPPRC
ncbi:MAG TPA: glycosyltransferase [Immundisolibacter sp.]|nr:glycosyltransferase [Immundisolibacter sp.]